LGAPGDAGLDLAEHASLFFACLSGAIMITLKKWVIMVDCYT